MRIKMWQLSLVVVFGLCVVGCGPADGGSGNGHGSGSFDVNKLLRACTILKSCFNGYDFGDIGGCVGDFKLHGSPVQVDCVLAASMADCAAAEACVGEAIVSDASCVDRCLDDHTLVQCITSASLHLESDCRTAFSSEGPSCLVGTRVGCGVGSCSTEGAKTCDGTVSHYCSSGIERVLDCSLSGYECSTTASSLCAPPSPGACAGAFECQGDLLCDMRGTTDCSQVVPDGTCTLVLNRFLACGWGDQCDVTSVPDMCFGTTLRSCVLGLVKDTDCTTIGGTQCVPRSGPLGGVCSL